LITNRKKVKNKSKISDKNFLTPKIIKPNNFKTVQRNKNKLIIIKKKHLIKIINCQKKETKLFIKANHRLTK